MSHIKKSVYMWYKAVAPFQCSAANFFTLTNKTGISSKLIVGRTEKEHFNKGNQ
jgi:hypothetical protein